MHMGEYQEAETILVEVSYGRHRGHACVTTSRSLGVGFRRDVGVGDKRYCLAPMGGAPPAVGMLTACNGLMLVVAETGEFPVCRSVRFDKDGSCHSHPAPKISLCSSKTCPPMGAREIDRTTPPSGYRASKPAQDFSFVVLCVGGRPRGPLRKGTVDKSSLSLNHMVSICAWRLV